MNYINNTFIDNYNNDGNGVISHNELGGSEERKTQKNEFNASRDERARAKEEKSRFALLRFDNNHFTCQLFSLALALFFHHLILNSLCVDAYGQHM
jgi:hypothetical protein